MIDMYEDIVPEDKKKKGKDAKRIDEIDGTKVLSLKEARALSFKVNPRIRKVFERVTKLHEPISTAMRQVGYKSTTKKEMSDTTGLRPKDMTESKSWKLLLQTYFPDEYLAQRQDFVISQDKDLSNLNRGLENVYRLKGKEGFTKGEGDGGDVNIQINYIKSY